MKFKPTKEQENAIFAPSGTLVSAAAGSGKTAVLVERVIQKLCGENPVPADKLLVVTFTNAAAEEMRMRIEKRLNEECLKNPDNPILIKQKMLVRSAQICTIDSFCIAVIRENFDRLGIAPDFNIGDESTMVALSESALNEVLNNAFEENSPEFSELLEAATSDYDESVLKDIIKDIYDFSQNMPFPEEWIKEVLLTQQNDQFVHQITDRCFEHACDVVNKCILQLSACIKQLSNFEGNCEKYTDNLSESVEYLNSLLEKCTAKDWDGCFKILSSPVFERWPSVKGLSGEPVVIGAKALRESVKEETQNLAKIFYADFASINADISFSQRANIKLLELVLEFSAIYKKLRTDKNLLTFSDTEHLALSLLCRFENGNLVLNESGADIIDRYDEVLVDEFQDVNNMQDILFSVLSGNEKKLFVVGDLKQSIYGFRGANPDNFIKKKNSYVPFEISDSEQLKKIILGNNFRSRKGVCDYINFVFTALMNKGLSDLQYNEEEQLYPKAQYPDAGFPSVDLHFVDTDSKINRKSDEAKAIAAFIKDFMENGYIMDKQNGELRRPRYSDFTVLFRSISSNGPYYLSELTKYGIPVDYTSDEFMNMAEIQMVLSLLSVIENPTRDIELISVLMSPIFCFSADDLANIRLVKRGTNLISAVVSAAEAGNKKCADFLKKLNSFTNLAVANDLGDLISALYESTGILNIVAVLKNGETRRQNLLMLQGMAAEYDNNGFSKNISAFIRYLQKLDAAGSLKSSASAEHEDSVKLMTVHKSKGLQFPICILADTSSNFSSADTKNNVLINEQLGISFKFNDEEGQSTTSTVLRELITVKAEQKRLDEELRLLYVALTRAEEKLVVFDTDKDIASNIANYAVLLNQCDDLDKYRELLPRQKSFADLIFSATVIHPAFMDLRVKNGVSGFFIETNGLLNINLYSADSLQIESVDIEKSDTETLQNEEVVQQIRNNIKFVYPYQQIKNIESKAAVADIAHKAEMRDFSFTAKPSFMSKKGMTPAQRGTATHRFMQFADFGLAKSDLSAEIERLYEWQFITLKEKEAIDIPSVERFFESDIFRRIERADRLEREMRFLTEIPAGNLYQDIPEQLSDEKIVVQGAVDCVFAENGEIVVIDFKTDRVSESNQLIEAYAEQLNIYAKACSKIFGMPVKEKIIYSFALSKEIKLL